MFGDSLVAGYGVAADAALPQKLQEALDAKQIPAKVINEGISGDTTAGGRGRVEWMLKRHQPQIVIVVLGGNDVLRGFPPQQSKENMQAIVKAIAATGAKVVIAPMQSAANMGDDYNQQFNRIFQDVADEFDTEITPPILQDIYGNSELTQADGIHPNAKGVLVMVDHILPSIEKLMDAHE